MVKLSQRFFFTNWYNETTKCGDKVSLEILEKLSTCRAMSQYANFSQKEEMLLDDVVDNAIAVKNKVP
jgi:hypothetical protein